MEIRFLLKTQAAAICLIGFAVCIAAYYPGVMTPDSQMMYRQAQTLAFNDAWPPIFALIWAAIALVKPGPHGMFLLLLSLHWGGLLVLGVAVSRIAAWAILLPPLLGLMPYTINFAGHLWTDILLAGCWLACIALIFEAQTRGAAVSAIRLACCWTLFAIGALSRFNALFAAIPLALYLLRPSHGFSIRSRAILSIAIAASIVAAGWVLSNVILKADKGHTVQAILVYDLGGISHFTKQNKFPITFNDEQLRHVIDDCYNPESWNSYGAFGCRFVYQGLADNGWWGAGKLWRHWAYTVAAEPSAYLKHRIGHFRWFSLRPNYIFHQGETPEEIKQRLSANPYLNALRDYVFWRIYHWYFLPIFWLVLSVAGAIIATRLPEPGGRLAGALCWSATLYIAPYFVVGVGSDFRYVYWPALAVSAAAIMILAQAYAQVATSLMRRFSAPALASSPADAQPHREVGDFPPAGS
jgi:hypothetical protein